MAAFLGVLLELFVALMILLFEVIPAFFRAIKNAARKLLVKHSMVKFILLGSVSLLVLFGLLYMETLNWPSLWREVKLDDDRAHVLQNLGKPRVAAWDVKGDEWAKDTGIGFAVLRITYFPSDRGTNVTSIRMTSYLGNREFRLKLKQSYSHTLTNRILDAN